MPELALALLVSLVAAQGDESMLPPEDDELPQAPTEEEQDRRYGSGAHVFTYQLAQVSRAEVTDGRTRVSVENGQPTPNAGYFPVRVFVDNRLGPRGPLTLTLRGSVAQGVHSATRTVELAEGERRVVNLPVPAELRYGTLSARGPGVGGKNSANVYFGAVYPPNRAMLALGKPESFERFVGKPPSYSGGEAQVMVIPPEEAPAELVAYLGYDTIVLPDAETLEVLSDGQRRALEGYAAAGGTLLLHGPVRMKSLFPLTSDLTRAEQRYGLGTLAITAATPVRPELISSQALPVLPQGPPPEWQQRYGGTAWNVLLPQATAPLGRFLLIIGAFTLLIGPGSLWVARRRGPAFLLLTIPATAITTCAAIVGYSLVSDGFTVHGAVYGYTLLDRSSNRAITAGITAYYANLAPSEVVFPANTAVIGPFVEGRDRYVASVEWRDGARFGSDFVPSRVYREWGLVSVEPTRARVVVKKKGDVLLAQNALGHRLGMLIVQHGDERYLATDVPDGAERPLLRDRNAVLPGLAGHAEDRFAPEVRSAVMDAPLKSGQFLATIKGQGFVPTGGIRLSLHESAHVVRGEVEE